ncbi:hypothetical protein QJS66_14595 [Kocuria rhizophila]|nr:hypothetical protein QJS66_14595 [Kocuria rhizophila]
MGIVLGTSVPARGRPARQLGGGASRGAVARAGRVARVDGAASRHRLLLIRIPRFLVAAGREDEARSVLSRTTVTTPWTCAWTRSAPP